MVDTDSKNQLVLRGRLHITACKDEGSTLKPYLVEKKTVVVSKVLMLESAFVPA